MMPRMQCSLLVLLQCIILLCTTTESFTGHDCRRSLLCPPSTTVPGSRRPLRAGETIYDETNRSLETSLGDTSKNGHSRRTMGVVFVQSLLVGAFSWDRFSQVANADETYFLKGTISLSKGLSPPSEAGISKSDNEESLRTNSALYVTARPDRPDNVPRAILDGSRGKPPPVLAARFENPAFPFEFQLSEKDLTPEGADQNGNDFWWNADDLIVSARWDSDGVAATRSPEDLVGRNVWKNGKSDNFILDLQGRGTFGKFATKKN